MKSIQTELKQINKKLENVMTKNDETLKTLIKETIQTMKEELLASTEKKVEILEGKLFEKEKEIDKMKTEYDKMKEDISRLSKDMSDQNANIDRYKYEMRDNALKTDEYLNDCEQYSRVNNIRIFGIPEETFPKIQVRNEKKKLDENIDTKPAEKDTSENSESAEKKSVESNHDTYAMKVSNTEEENEKQVSENDEQTTEIVRKKLNEYVPGLNLKREDFVISHRIGAKGDKPRPIIAQLKSRLDKNKVMRNRKLFPKSISIMDDLTAENYKTLQSVKYKKPDLVQAAWFRNGKIFYKDQTDHVIQLHYKNFRFWQNLAWPEAPRKRGTSNRLA
ncbi:uncharacterized protein LOC128546645 [Mercenaria mercenaria]|uniref:uncharacterized protein LOC128546645 n=1 Tax=Mercenaria mercenaria TaxID=6596 RepID=UPI00234F3111|nr:uncharacterized protein LOC128546645 [Mercenaria mercenaria]